MGGNTRMNISTILQNWPLQAVAAAADEVVFMVSGVPLVTKGEGKGK